MNWTIRLEHRDAVTRAFLERDRAWATYPLADLDPPYREHARFYVAAQDGTDLAVVLIYTPPEFAAISTMGDPRAVAAALSDIPDLPRRTHLLIPVDHRDSLTLHYTPQEWWRMQRMALRPADLRLPDDMPDPIRLSETDATGIEVLLNGRDFEAFFTPLMLESGVYYGIRKQHQLVAVAGTHVVSHTSCVAAIGNVYTAPHARGRGYATRTTAAVARELFHRGCQRVILNVNTQNRPAIRVYERLGFRTHVEFWEAPGADRI